jgi:hypothetical protein
VVIESLYIIVQPRGAGGQAQIEGNMPIPSDGTTFRHNIKEDGNANRTNVTFGVFATI